MGLWFFPIALGGGFGGGNRDTMVLVGETVIVGGAAVIRVGGVQEANMFAVGAASQGARLG